MVQPAHGLATLSLALVIVLFLASPVAAHGNYISMDPQVSHDGTIRVEFAVIVDDGFVVLHTDAGGEPGDPVGHRSIEPFLNPDFAVSLTNEYWTNQSGNLSLWAVLHHDNGDGQFDPGDDPALTTGPDNRIVADHFLVRKAPSGTTNVIAERDHPQETDRNRVKLRTVRLAADGYVSIRADNEGSPGRIVGKKALSAGEHTSVSVTIDQQFYERRPENFALWAVVHTSDGDEVFDATEDPVVRVGNATVRTRFDVERTDPIEQTQTPESTPTQTATPSSSTDTPTEIASTTSTQTRVPTETITPPTAESVPTTTTVDTCLGQTHTHAEGQVHTHCGTPTAVTVPGFGFVVALVAVLLSVLIAVRQWG